MSYNYKAHGNNQKSYGILYSAVIAFTISACTVIHYAVKYEVGRYLSINDEISIEDYSRLSNFKTWEKCAANNALQEKVKQSSQDGVITNREYLGFYLMWEQCRAQTIEDIERENKDQLIKEMNNATTKIHH